ncbi:MAG: hypothetical protein EA375_03670 [Acholeplasmataceae bacterium]|nr:MAG: hypothetical protein EA375_03670 [Acholeplasmataceae bacterium]
MTFKNRVIAAMPLISLLLFLFAGLYLENWNLGWTFFLLIPLSIVLLTGKPLKRLSEVMPFISLIVFLWLGFGFELWHPGWAVFLLIPLVNILVDGKIPPRKLVGLLITGGYLAIGLVTDQWHPTWIIFLLIPIINTIFFPQQSAYVSMTRNSFKNRFKDIIINAKTSDDEDDL